MIQNKFATAPIFHSLADLNLGQPLWRFTISFITPYMDITTQSLPTWRCNRLVLSPLWTLIFHRELYFLVIVTITVVTQFTNRFMTPVGSKITDWWYPSHVCNYLPYKQVFLGILGSSNIFFSAPLIPPTIISVDLPKYVNYSSVVKHFTYNSVSSPWSIITSILDLLGVISLVHNYISVYVLITKV